MKRTSFFTFLFIAMLSMLARNASAQQSGTSSLSNEAPLRFKIEKPSFCIYLSPQGKITGYDVKAEGDISYDLEGRVRQIGLVEISYDLYNRIRKIATNEITYDINGRVSGVGNTKISYTFSNISHIGT